jgi:prolipoprotein diacylglyceryltransferase
VFISGSLIGFLVEWYGITREIWSYPHGQQLPPLLMIIAWGCVSLTIVHLSLIFNFIEQEEEHKIRKWLRKEKLIK